jgi:hypothetical protein
MRVTEQHLKIKEDNMKITAKEIGIGHRVQTDKMLAGYILAYDILKKGKKIIIRNQMGREVEFEENQIVKIIYS